MSDPVRQHYVPQSYLRNFTDKTGYLHIYLARRDKYIKQLPKNTAYQKHFYTIDQNGEKDYFIEKLLAEHVDNLYPPIISKITNKEKLSHEDREALALFVSIQYLRTPAHRENHNRMLKDMYRRVIEMVLTSKVHQGELKKETLEEFEEVGINVPKENSLGFMLDFFEEMAQKIVKHDFIIAEASKKSEFITTDNPYSMMHEPGNSRQDGYGILNTIKFFPLTPKYLLVLRTPKNLKLGGQTIYMKHSTKEIQKINIHIANWGHNFIYSTNEHRLKSVIKKWKKSLK